MNKFRNIYRIPSARLQKRDYGLPGFYFITICTKNRECYFGEIRNGEMFLNELGKIAHEEWVKTPQIRPDMNLDSGKFVVMPNHFHGIVMIGENKYNTLQNIQHSRDDGNCDDAGNCRDAMHGVSARDKKHKCLS